MGAKFVPTAVTGGLGPALAMVAGLAVALSGAVALSPLGPLEPVRQFDPVRAPAPFSSSVAGVADDVRVPVRSPSAPGSSWSHRPAVAGQQGRST
jgi:hypothetical protein